MSNEDSDLVFGNVSGATEDDLSCQHFASSKMMTDTIHEFMGKEHGKNEILDPPHKAAPKVNLEHAVVVEEGPRLSPYAHLITAAVVGASTALIKGASSRDQSALATSASTVLSGSVAAILQNYAAGAIGKNSSEKSKMLCATGIGLATGSIGSDIASHISSSSEEDFDISKSVQDALKLSGTGISVATTFSSMLYNGDNDNYLDYDRDKDDLGAF